MLIDGLDFPFIYPEEYTPVFFRALSGIAVVAADRFAVSGRGAAGGVSCQSSRFTTGMLLVELFEFEDLLLEARLHHLGIDFGALLLSAQFVDLLVQLIPRLRPLR